MKYAPFLVCVLLCCGMVGAADVKTRSRVDDRKAQLLAQTKERIQQIDSVLGTVKWEPVKAASSKIAEPDRKLEAEFNQWLGDLRVRLQSLRKEMQFGTTLGGEDMVQKMAEMNRQFMALQDEVQKQGRRFATLSNASKARHEALMNAFRNLR